MSLFEVVIVQPIFNFLLGIYSLIPGGDLGFAIIIFTILVRFAFWPLLKKQLHQTRAMQKLQPELARIKKECAGNKQLEGMRMMELYKEYGVSPFRSIGVLLIQLPIFIALYRVIRIISVDQFGIENFTYGFMKGFEPVAKLIADPATLNQKFLGFIDLTGQAITQNPTTVSVVLLVLAIAAAGTQILLTRQTTPKNMPKRRMRDIMAEASKGKEVDQSEINAITTKNMMYFMPVMMLFIMVYLPGAITLYYLASNLVAYAQQRSILKKDSAEMIEMTDELPKINKKATAKAREKQAQEGTVIRITAKDNAPKKSK